MNKLSDDCLLSSVLNTDGVQGDKTAARHNALEYEFLVEGDDTGGPVPGHLPGVLDREQRTQLGDERG